MMSDKNFQEYLTLSKAWRSLLDSRNRLLNEQSTYSQIGDSEKASDKLSESIGYGQACNDLFKIMQSLETPQQLELELGDY
jgi:division protein CdvB (Snf7/Vps24/ESCRT-III family)